jgi:hypothetical protein
MGEMKERTIMQGLQSKVSFQAHMNDPRRIANRAHVFAFQHEPYFDGVSFQVDPMRIRRHGHEASDIP